MSDKLVVEIDSKDAEVAMRNLDRLTTAAEQMGKAFENTKGATSALRELRLMLTGIKGQGSSLDELKNSIQSLNSTADSLKRSFAGSVGQLGRIFKNEMAELKSIVQETSLGIGKAAADSLSDGIASPESRRKVVGAMRAQVAEMQAAYEQELAKGVKFSGRDLFDFKSWGLNIGADAKQAIRDGLVKDAAPIPVERILGLDKSQVVKSAKDSATVFQEAYSVEMAQGRLLFKNFEQALGLDKSQVVKSAKDSAAVFREAYNAEMRSMQRSAMPVAKVSRIDAADATYASAMAQMKDYYKGLELSANSGVASAGKMSNAFKRLTIDGNDAHSMVRGLASGFNLLWLTWGNLVPLFAGAAISNGFMQTIKLGTQVGHTFQTIASLGEVSAEGVAMLRTQLYEIGQSGPYGPEQVAEAMKTLALAGLQLNEILAVTPTVLNFALAGTTSITQAADVLVSVTSAFGTGAAGFEESADIITRSAADSKASVESFGEAMKTASVVGELYGAAQRDVALMIQYLSQVGIQGTSAGTAVRNAMADISGGSGQAQRILKSLGAEFRQSTGEVIPFIDQMRELNRITKDYDAVSQKNIINAIYGERGSKVAAVGLQAFNTAAKDASKYSNKLEEDLARLEDAAGDSAIASAQMAQSTQKAFEAVAATAKTVLVEAFDTIEPQMYLVADALRKAFASDEAKEGLRTLVTAIADLALVVAKNLPMIVEYGLAWAAFKVAVFGINAIVTTATALLGLYTNAKIKDTAATIAQTGAEAALSKAIDSKKTATLTSGAAALSMGTKLLGVLPIVGNAVLLGSLAWDLYKSSVDGAGKTVDNYVDTKADNIITALENETRHIREVNELRAQGLTLMEAEARVKFSNNKSEMLSASEAKIEASEAEIRGLRTANASYNDPTAVSYGLLQRRENTAKILALEAEISKARSEQGTNTLRMTLAENERKEAAQEALRLTRLEQEAAAKSTVTGTKTWSLDEFQGGGKGFGGPREFYEAQKTAFDKSIQEIEKRGKVEIEKLQSIAADKKAILDSEQQAGLLSTEEYNSQLMVLLKSSEDAQIAEIRKTSQDFRAEYDKRHRTISDLIAKAEATSAKGKGASAAKAANLKELRAELSTLEELGVTSSEQWASAIDKLTSRYDKDLQVAINKNLGSLKKLREEDDKFWKDQTDELAKAKALDAVNQQYANINDSVFSLDEANKAYALAFADSFAKVEAYVGKLNTELETAQYAAEEFWHAAMADGEFSDTDSSGYISYLKKIQGLEKLIIDARAKGATLADDAGNLAFDRKRREQNTKLANDLSDAVMTGLFDGAEAGKKKLRDVLVAELRKPIKLVIDLVINAAVNGVMNSLGMGGGGGGGGSSFLSSTGGSMLGVGNMGSIGAGFMSGVSETVLGSTFVGPSATAAGGATGTAAQLGVVAPYIAAAAAIYMIAKSFDDSGTYHTGGAAQYSAATGLRTSLGFRDNEEGLPSYNPNDNIDNQFGTGFGYVERGDQTISAVSGIAQALGTMLDGFAVAFGEKAGYEVATAFADDTSKDGAWGALRISKDGQELLNWENTRQSKWAPKEFGDGEEGYKQYLAAVAKDTRQVLLDMDLPSWADTMLESIGEAANMDQLAATVQQIGVIQTSFVNLGKTIDGFAGMTDKAFEALMKAAGGIDALSTNAGTYYENFYSEAERAAKTTAMLTEEVAKYGVKLPKTKEDYRKLVEEQLAAGEEGAKFAAVLLALSGVFAETANAAEAAAASIAGKRFDLENRLLTLQGKDREALDRQRGKEYDALWKESPELARMAAQIWALEDAANFTAAAYSALEKAIAREREALEVQRSLAAESVDTLTGIFETIRSNVRELYGEVGGTVAMQVSQANAFIDNALRAAQTTGYMPDGSQLSEAISAARSGLSSGAYTSQFEADRDRLVLAGKLSALGEITGEQLTTAERQLKYSQEQIEQLDKTLDYWREQIDIANGTYEATLSVAEAIGKLQALMFPAKEKVPETNRPTASFGGGSFGGGGSGIGKVTISADGTRTYEDGSTSKLTENELDLYRRGLLGKVPAFAVGTNYVPRDMLAQIHEGEAIVPKAYNPAANTSMGGGNSEVVSELRALREENRQQAGEIARLNLRMARVLEKFDGDGMPATRDEAVV